MYLAPSARGQGFGRRLLEHALARAADLGFSRVVLETASVLREAVALYERYGFQRYTTEHLASRCDTAYYLDLNHDLARGGTRGARIIPKPSCIVTAPTARGKIAAPH